MDNGTNYGEDCAQEHDIKRERICKMFTSGEATVVVDEDTKEPIFRIVDMNCQDGEWNQEEIIFSAKTFPVGTKITIEEPE